MGAAQQKVLLGRSGLLLLLLLRYLLLGEVLGLLFFVQNPFHETRRLFGLLVVAVGEVSLLLLVEIIVLVFVLFVAVVDRGGGFCCFWDFWCFLCSVLGS